MWPKLTAEINVWLGALRGLRPALLVLAILFFTIMLLEVALGHRPTIAAQESWLALIPVVWLPVTLIALMAVHVAPCLATVAIALAVTAVAAAVGMIGSGLHMMAAGVDFEHLGRAFSSAVWGGRVSPNWPVAIAVAAVLGFIAVLGAQREGTSLRSDAAGVATVIAYVLIVAGIGFSAFPALVTVSASCLAGAALLLLAVLVGMLASAAMERSVS